MGTENQIKIQIPAGHTAKIENNTAIFEPKTAKFEKGDFISSVGGYVYIFNRHKGKYYDWFAKARTDRDAIATVGNNDEYYTDDYEGSFRLAADSEKQTLLDKLHEAGKDWDAEKCEIVNFVWKPKTGDSIWSINAKGLINEWTFSGRGSFVPDSMDFSTRELAESALELLKQAKHY